MTHITSRYLTLRAAADTASIRNATFEDAPHLIVPVVALVGNQVIHPMGAPGPEYVPLDQLRQAPGGWNGRPILPDHPGLDSANTPKTLESQRFGWMFNTEVKDGKLKTEAWLDTAKAKKLGGDAQRVVDRCLSGETVEVSIGAWVSTDQVEGTTQDGKRYVAIWRDITPDHLAMLPEGVEGACSVDMGCGAPRLNKQEVTSSSTKERSMRTATDKRTPEARSSVEGVSFNNLRELLEDAIRDAETGFTFLWVVDIFDTSVVYELNTDNGQEQMYERGYTITGQGESAKVELASERSEVVKRVEYVKKEAKKQKVNNAPSIVQRILSAIGLNTTNNFESAADEQSDVDIRTALYDELYATEAGFDSIAEVFHDSRTVIYVTFARDELSWYRRSYEVGEDGKLTLSDDKQQVELVQKYEPVTAKSNSESDKEQESMTATNPDPTPTKISAVDALIANPDSPFGEADKTALTAMSESCLSKLSANWTKKEGKEAADNRGKEGPGTAAFLQRKKEEEEKEAKAAKSDTASEQPSPTTTNSPQTVAVTVEEWQQVKAAADNYHAARARRKNELVQALTACKAASTVYTVDDYKTATVEELEKLAKALGAIQDPANHTATNFAQRGFPLGDPSTDNNIYLNPPDAWAVNKAQPAQTDKGAN